MKKSDKETKKYEMKISNTVNEMDEEVRDRFKALAHISVKLAEISKMHDEEVKQVDFAADQTDKPIYALRALIIQGKEYDTSEINIDEFDKRLQEIQDEKYEKIKVKKSKTVDNLIDKDGIPDFWLIALK